MTEPTAITKQTEGRWPASVCFVIAVGSVFLSLVACAGAREERASLPARVSTILNEAELDAALQQTATAALGEREGAIIVIDPQNGRLRAVVNARVAFEQVFPPGSAIKPFTALAALHTGTLDRATKHQCQTTYARAGFEIACAHPRSQAPFNLSQALAYSCNDYFAHLAERLSAGNFAATLAAFGFGARTGINATEAIGSLPRGDWHVRHALGESEQLLVTPLQLLTAYAALINGGHLYRPQRVMEQNLVAQETTRLKLAPEQRDLLIEGMRGAVKYGTAAKAGLGDLPGYVFGKTGTSTASNSFRTQGWFVGFAGKRRAVDVPQPAEIELGVLVFLKRAHGSQGAEVAKPIFERAMQRVARPEQEERAGGEIYLHRRDAEATQSYAESFTLRSFARSLRLGGEMEPVSESLPITRELVPITNAQSIRVRSVSENVTRELPLEEYLVGVLAGEASIENEFVALQAQAVVSRSFALRNRQRHARAGYDFCSTTHCQRFVLPKTRTAARRAVATTSGEVLFDQAGQVADVYFHAACGGVTANIATLWGVPAPAYLRSVRDEFCVTMPHYKWEQTITAAQLTQALRSDARTAVDGLQDIVVSKRDATGRAETITLVGNERRTVRGWDFKLIIGRSLGWQMIKSSRFEVRRVGEAFVFRGGGFGHGLGLCQEGAHAAAQRGLSYRQILRHYFPGARLQQQLASQWTTAPARRIFAPEAQRKLAGSATTGAAFDQSPNPGGATDQEYGLSPPRGWGSLFTLTPVVAPPADLRRSFGTETPVALRTDNFERRLDQPSHAIANQRQTLSSRHFRLSFAVGTDRAAVAKALRTLENALSDLQRRLQSAAVSLPEAEPFAINIHATTADFIRATGLSGWASGATRGRRIELQPLALLQRRGVLATTLRHELTHAVVETLSHGRAPRWLAEGLAVHVAGEGVTLPNLASQPSLSRDELERRLKQPSSLAETRRLYALAYREVRAFIARAGEPRVWQSVVKENSL